MADLTQEDWINKLNEDEHAVILDVRTDNEVAYGKIPHAIQLDFYKGQEFVSELEKLDKNKSYFVYCRSGNRSGQACKIMEHLGIQNAYNLAGGMLQWRGEVEQ